MNINILFTTYLYDVIVVVVVVVVVSYTHLDVYKRQPLTS